MSGLLSLDIGQIDFNRPKFQMVGGLTLRDIKIKYNWIMNAQVQDAIIGEDENGLVWYSGNWICGTWENGTWYSGIFVDGRWKDGSFYSYDIDIKEALNGRLHINRVDIMKSRFIGGTFESGTFHYGIFGIIRNEEDVTLPVIMTDEYVIENILDFTVASGNTFIHLPDGSFEYVELLAPKFENGTFKNGFFNSAYFVNGNWYNGIANNIIWFNGTWYDGSFLYGEWHDGIFFKGYFSNGNWYNGKFLTNDIKTPSLFGLNYKNETGVNGIKYGANWYNGEFINGHFYTGVVSYGNYTPLTDNTISTWYNGTFTNGIWYGGTWENGTWTTGTFKYGIIKNIYWKNGNIMDCICLNGTFLNVDVNGGVFNNVSFNQVNLGIDT